MFAVGLTGGIGSGKSQVAAWLELWGAEVIDTDVIAHELTAPQAAGSLALAQEFGALALTQEGALDRAWMRELVFSQPQARKRLEAIMHPLIRQRVRELASQASGLYLVYVVPLLIESGNWRKYLDRICVVDSDEQTQIQRVQQRSGLTRAVIERIMSAQATRQKRLEHADDIILNDGATSLARLRLRTRQKHDLWCKLAAGVRQT